MPRLALNGGPREAEDLVKSVCKWPYATEDDIRSVVEVLRSGRWCRLYPGSKAEEFEAEFACYHDAKYGIAVANGTVALELALKTIGVKVGDEVIVPAVTFIATASAVTEVGGIPVFADINPETGTISPDSIRDLVNKKTRAVIAVHYSGYPSDFDEILPIIRDNNLFLIEDCAHAHGTEWKGRKVGAIGDMGCFSFQESKSLTAGEGGIVLTDRDDLAEKARLIHNIGRVIGRPGYEHYVLSSNYRMTEMQAALLLSKLKALPKETEIKDVNGQYLARELRRVGGVEPLKEDPRVTRRGYYFFVIKYDREEFYGLPREVFVKALNAEGVPAGMGYGMPLYKQPAFKREKISSLFPEWVRTPEYEKLKLEGAEEFTAREVTIPHWILLSERRKLDLIVSSIEKIKENVDELLQ